MCSDVSRQKRNSQDKSLPSLLSESTDQLKIQSSRCFQAVSLIYDQGLRPCPNKLCSYDVLDVCDAYNSYRILCILIAYILDHWLLLL